MAEAPKGTATLMKYFGKLPGKTLADFKKEADELTDTDKQQLVSGITDGSLTY